MLNSIFRTLIEENRYILILNGLGATIIISLFSLLFGTILGIMLCALRKSKNHLIASLSKLYISIMRGIPITLLLLVFYYVIFGFVNISPIIVAIITFAIYFSVYISEVFRSGIDSVSESQIFSALSLGFTKLQTLLYITIPQSLITIIPNFKNEALSLIKLTSIVGYISVIDLTKASDIIRNRTYEAFLPLIITAILYGIICIVTSFLLDILYRGVNKRFYNRSENNVRD